MSATVGAQTQGQDPSVPSNGQEPGVEEGLLDAPLDPGAAPEPGAVGASTATEVAYPNLGSQLSDLAVAASAAAPPSLDGGTNATASSGARLLAIQLDGNPDEVLDFLDRNGIAPANVVGDYLEVYVPPDLLAPLSQQTGVSRVREMPQAFKELGPTLSKGVEFHGADVWHRGGFTGDGVKVGVIDTPTTSTSRDGFTGLRALQGNELPSTVVGRCYTDVGKPTSNLANCDAAGGDEHGTLVAETLMDVAPDADLYISNPRSFADLHSAVVWMHGQGVKVIVQSVSYAYHGSADGTSPVNPSPLNTVKWAADNGIVWVNAAGNRARLGWLGSFNDSDSDNIHEWASNGTAVDEAQSFYLNRDAKLSLFLRWDDAWGGASKDLDIEVRYSSTFGGAQTVLGGSYDVQNGSGADYPYESIILSASRTGHYWIYVKKKASSSAPSWLQMMMFSGSVSSLDHYTTSGTVSSPGDSSHPAVLSVGATSSHTATSVRHYSSRGPTPDGRTKPDVVGIDCTATSSRTRFCGTSQAAPHVAGLAALVLDRNPAFTPTQVASYLESNAADRGAVGVDNTWGHGFASLPPDGFNDCGTPVSLSGNGSVDGEWTASCESQTRTGSYARFYTFTLASQSKVTINLKSSVDTYLYLRSGKDKHSGDALQYDDDSGGDYNSQIVETLPAGDYTIEATTFHGLQVGSFKLTVAGLPTVQAVEPVVSITAGSDVTEGGDATFTVTADPAPSSALTVDVTVAQSGDFGASTGSRQVTVPTSGSATHTVATTNDSTDEADGSITATVDDGSGYTVSSTAGSATVAVADDDDPVEPEVSITAGSDVTEGGDATFTVTADPAPSSALTVDVTVAQSGDFGASTGSRQVTVPTSGSATHTVATTNDSTDEADGSITVTVDGGSGYTVSSTAGSATVAVADDDDPPVVVDACMSTLSSDGSIDGEWTSVCASVDRTDRYARFFTFSLASQSTVTIDLESSVDTYLALRSGKARKSGNAVQYDDDGGRGYNSRIVETVQAGDYTIEATTYSRSRTGSFKLTVAGLPTAQAVEPEVSITAGSDVTEGGDAVFTVAASPAPSAALTVDVTVAQSGDFGASTGPRQVTVSTSGTATLTLSTAGDSVDEPDGSVTVTVDDGSGYSVSSTAGSASVAVADDDDDPPQPPVCTVQLPSDAVTVSEVTGWRDGHSGAAHVLRWNRVLAALGVDTGETAMTVAESRANEGQFMLSRWDRVTRTLEAHAQCNNPSPAPPPPPPVVEPEVSITAGSGVTEGGDAVFTVTADPGPSSPLTVDVTVTASGDFGVSTGARQVTISTSGSATLTVSTVDDSVDEIDGSVTVTVDGGSGYTVSSVAGSATAAIADDDDPAPLPPPPPPVVEPEVSISAGSGVTEGGDAVFTVTADPAPSAALAVDVTVTASGDFGAATGSRQVTVPASGTVTLTVPTINDTVDETDGSVTVTVDDASGYTVSATANSASVTVSDDDDPAPPPPPPPPVAETGFSIGDASGTEGEQVSVTVTLSHASTQRLRVYWKTDFGGSSAWNPRNPIWAVTDVDFARASGWLTFEPGVVERQVQVSLLEDSRVEPVEEFQVNLVFVSPFGAVPIANRRAIITINDND